MSGRLFGMATAAEQNEGGIEGTDWEVFARDPMIARRVGALLSVGAQAPANLVPPGAAVRHGDLDVLRADLDRARLLGANAYRFSIEWARIEPRPGQWRDDVLEGYYLKVIEELIARDMEPVVTLQHLSLPAWVLTPPSRTHWLGPVPFASGRDPGFMRSLRGWESTRTVDAYATFVARIAPALRDAGVRWWIPLNEPSASVVGLGYIGGIWPPGFTIAGNRARAAHFNLLRAHVQAFDLIKKCDPNARVGVAHAMTPFRSLARPGLMHRADAHATAQADYFFNLHFLDSVITGKVDVAADRLRPRWSSAREFFDLGKEQWRPHLDFVGVNYYRPFTIRWHPLISLRAGLAGGLLTEVPAPVQTDSGGVVEPGGLLEVVRRLHARYALPLLITENGIAESSDRIRAPHLVANLESLRDAEVEGVRLLGYLYWTLVDNWEWDSGYEPSSRNGLFAVDFDRPDQPRALTEGALAFRHVAQGGSLDEASALYGSISPDGSAVRIPMRSPVVLWRQDTAAGEWLLSSTAVGDRQRALVFDPSPGRWREPTVEEWARLALDSRRDWREGAWVTEGVGAPFRALRLSAIGRWESPGSIGDRWLARTHDGVTWTRCHCAVDGDRVQLALDPPVDLRLEREVLLPAGQTWTLRRLP